MYESPNDNEVGTGTVKDMCNGCGDYYPGAVLCDRCTITRNTAIITDLFNFQPEAHYVGSAVANAGRAQWRAFSTNGDVLVVVDAGAAGRPFRADYNGTSIGFYETASQAARVLSKRYNDSFSS